MKRAVLLITLLWASAASAGPLEGQGRVTLLGGWRITPNAAFYQRAAQTFGLTQSGGAGGPMLSATFAYSASDLFELGIDLFGSGERMTFTEANRFTTVTYGGWISLRMQLLAGSVGPVERLIPFIGAQGGPTLVLATGGPQSTFQEVFGQGYAATVGVTGLSGKFGFTLEAKYVFAWGSAAPVGTFSAGGIWAGLGFTWGFPPSGSEPSSPGRF